MKPQTSPIGKIGMKRDLLCLRKLLDSIASSFISLPHVVAVSRSVRATLLVSTIYTVESLGALHAVEAVPARPELLQTMAGALACRSIRTITMSRTVWCIMKHINLKATAFVIRSSGTAALPSPADDGGAGGIWQVNAFSLFSVHVSCPLT